MVFGKVVGTVVSTQKCDTTPGIKHLLVERSSSKGEGNGDYIVALDQQGTGPGELVLIAEGSSTRQTEATYQKPVDALIVGIVDLVESHGEIIYRK